jgi:hypothetical protein
METIFDANQWALFNRAKKKPEAGRGARHPV